MDESGGSDRSSEALLKRLGALYKRHLVLFVVGGIAIDVVLVVGGLWWFGIFGGDEADAALERCTDARFDAVAVIGACTEVVALSQPLGADDREPAERIAHALTVVQVQCRTALDRAAIRLCAEVPVVDAVVPAVSVRIRVEALLRLADHARLIEEATRLVALGDDYGYLARGLARHATADYDGAARDYRMAMKQFPDDPMLLDNLARAEVSAPPR